MNYKLILNTLGKLLIVFGLVLFLPLIVSICYKENNHLSYIITMLIALITGFLCTLIKPKRKTLFAKEGFVIVGLSWIILSLVGSIPYLLSPKIDGVVNSFFESISAFTTTGASVIEDLDNVGYNLLFYRSLSHWLGGMGVLVFVLALLPASDGGTMHILRAESPGPSVGKLTSKITLTARILYFIYTAFTLLEIILLICGGLSVIDSIIYSFGSLATGGASIHNDGLSSLSSYSQIVISIFMFLGGINFTIFFLILIGNYKQVLKNEELRYYVISIFIATLIISINLFSYTTKIYSIALKDSFFTSVSFITTTGYFQTDFNSWPELSKTILFFLMILGSCAGSTGGGLKISRTVILVKSIKRDIKKLIHPRSVSNIRFEGNVISEEVVTGVRGYFATIFIIFIISLLIISFDGFNFETNTTSILACLNNVGIGFSDVGPFNSFNGFSNISKITFMIIMLIGRLEIFPIIILFSPSIYKRLS